MKCKQCDTHMKYHVCYVYPDRDYAYNLYSCQKCGMICKDYVWNNKRQTWISLEGTITNELQKEA